VPLVKRLIEEAVQLFIAQQHEVSVWRLGRWKSETKHGKFCSKQLTDTYKADTCNGIIIITTFCQGWTLKKPTAYFLSDARDALQSRQDILK